MPDTIAVLQLEDNPDDAALNRRQLGEAGIQVDWRHVDNEADFLQELNRPPDVVLADYNLPGFDALRALRHMARLGLDIPFIVVSGTLGDELAAECIRRGASDYVLKDRLARLGQAVMSALEAKRVRNESAERAELLRISEERHRTLFESSKDAIYTLRRGEPMRLNPAGLEMFGFSLEELQSLTPAAVLRAEDYQRLLDLLRSKGFVKDFEVRMYRKDLTELTCVLTATARRNQSGEVIGHDGIVRDVTPLRRMQFQVEAANLELTQKVKELEALNRMFQQNLTERFAAIEAYERVLEDIERQPAAAAAILKEARARLRPS